MTQETQNNLGFDMEAFLDAVALEGEARFGSELGVLRARDRQREREDAKERELLDAARKRVRSAVRGMEVGQSVETAVLLDSLSGEGYSMGALTLALGALASEGVTSNERVVNDFGEIIEQATVRLR